MNSKEISWKWLTANQLLSHGPCELLYVSCINNYLDTYLYNGTSTNGELITRLGAYLVDNAPTASFYIQPLAEFRPLVPVYCEKGLYVVYGSAVGGVFVQWRETPRKAE